MPNGLCARCGQNPVYVTEGGSRSGYCLDCRTTYSAELYAIKTGLPESQRVAVLRRQHNSCAICSTPFSLHNPPCYDHEHKREVFRGFLCRSCNLGLGAFRDNIRVLAAAIVYLQDTEEAIETEYATRLERERIEREDEERVQSYLNSQRPNKLQPARRLPPRQRNCQDCNGYLNSLGICKRCGKENGQEK
jgi:hypothetical protein